MKLKNAHCEAFVCLNNLTGLAFLLQSVSTEMLLWGILLVNIIRVFMWRPAWCQWAGREWGGGVLKGAGWSWKGGNAKYTFGENANFSCLWRVCVSIQRLLAHCLWLQLSQQKAWQMAHICISLLEKEFATNNISCSFSFQNLQQIGQNGN